MSGGDGFRVAASITPLPCPGQRAPVGGFPCCGGGVCWCVASWGEGSVLYTAVTRAKRLVVLVGSKRVLSRCIDNADVNLRESALAERLKSAVQV